MGQHRPGSVWSLKRDRLGTYIRTVDKQTVELHFDLLYGTGIARMSRGDARLLARRINQCLDETTVK